MKLIDKAAVVAEINKRIMDAPIDCYGHQRVWAYNDVKNILDTLEVKEFDLDKEIDNFMVKEWDGIEENKDLYDMIKNDLSDIAKHFFELGIKAAQKGE
jgi:hypothetical protein